MVDKTILVVDDEKDLREAIAFDLQRRGYRVLVACDGQEALVLVAKHPVKLVISDVRMPGGGGAELLGKLRENNSFHPMLIFITGYTDMRPEEAYHLGAEAVFSKPFDRQTLYAAVEKALDPAEKRLARADVRLEIPAEAGLRFPASGIEAITGVLNIGRGGMFVALRGPFPEAHEQVDFRLRLPGEPVEIAGTGSVRWVRRERTESGPAGCGIEFERIQGDGLKRLFEIMRERKTKAFIPKR